MTRLPPVAALVAVACGGGWWLYMAMFWGRKAFIGLGCVFRV